MTAVRCAGAMVVASVLVSVAAGATPKPVPEDVLAKIVAGAPALPTDLDLGLQTHLIDFIDCTDPDDPHDFRDQGTSKVVTGPAGTYRATAAHRHAFFSYAYRTAGRDKPVLLVIEYPDDAERVISFMTDDSTRSPTRQGAYAQETGIYTGDPLPLTNRMRLFTLLAWPQDDWSPLMVFNFARYGSSGAASRIWVYAIDAMAPLVVDEPDAAHPRVLDAFFCCSFLAKRDNFGYRSPKSIEHMCQYFNLIGVNRVTMMVYMNQSWGAGCTIPAWDADDKGYLDDILTQMGRVGGVGFIAGIVADGMYGKVISGGKEVARMPLDEARAVILKGFDQFIDRYGKYKALKGVALGSMETIGFFDTLQSKGIADDVAAHVRKRRPDWEVLTYVGNVRLQTPQFDGKHGPAAWDVVAEWEATGGKPWSAFLAGKVRDNWKKWNHDPADLKAIPGLHVYEMFHPDDHRLCDLYRQEPRSMMFYDVDRSPERSRIADTPYAAIFGTFSEGEVGLHKDVNFWYTNPWTAPDFNAGGPFALAPFARAMAHRDRLAISAGTWSVKYFGLESQMRRFAKALRGLPPVEMQPMMGVMVEGADPPHSTDVVVGRWARYKGRRYMAVQNRVPMPCTVQVDSKTLTLEPYGLAAWSDEEAGEPGLLLRHHAEYVAWVAKRIADYEKLCEEVRALDPEAVPAAYLKAAQVARRELGNGHPYGADVALGAGLVNEMKLRKEILDPPALSAPRVGAAPAMAGDLDAWPAAASDVTAEGGQYLAGNIYSPNSWTGPDDLSMRLRFAHDGEKLYLGIEVRDSVLYKGDQCQVKIALGGGYLDWRGTERKIDLTWRVDAPTEGDLFTGAGKGGFQFTCRRTAKGYLVEGSVLLATLAARPGQGVGLLAMVNDQDGTPNLAKQRWARKQEMLVPHRPNFAYWSDARNCGKLVLGK